MRPAPPANMTNDGSHSYTYDAEGNITKVDGGTTATYVYDALNHRVRTTIGTAITEFVFNQNNQRVSVWNGGAKTVERDQYYWGNKPVAFTNAGAVHFQHQDWLGTERMRTTYNGSVEGSFTSLPFGDGQTTETGSDPYYFAALDYDGESGTDHAQYRQYSSTQGRWMRPDPYYGSYDFTNPQSLNRYAYVLNNPLAHIDPSGLTLCDYGDGDIEDTDNDWDECSATGGTPVNVGTTVEVDGNGGGFIEVDYTDLTGTIVLDYETFPGNNWTNLTPDQCAAARTVLAREAQTNTPAAARASGNTFGDGTLEPFNSTYVPNPQTPVGQIDLDWFTDDSGYGGGHYTNVIVYIGAKSLWTGQRLSNGMPVGNYLPFSDPGERNAVWQVFQGTAYSDIFTPAYMAQACGG